MTRVQTCALPIYRQRRRLYAEAHNRLSNPLYCLVFALIGTYALIGGDFNRRGYGRRIAIAGGAALAARLPGFGLQQLTNATPDAAFSMYLWPMLWVATLLILLSRDTFGKTSAQAGTVTTT